VGEDFAVTYSIGRAIAPGLTQPTENVRLSSAGEYFLDRSNQLDFAIARDFQVNKLRVRPSLDLYNALNANPVISAVNTYGPSFLSPRAILNARLMKVNVRLDF
jgi:hypothetical protein